MAMIDPARFNQFGPTASAFLNKPALGIPVLGHLINAPETLLGLGANMLPFITPSGSPSLNEAGDLGAMKSWEDRQDINPWLKLGLGFGAGMATTGPLFGAGMAAVKLPRSLSGLGMALQFADDLPALAKPLLGGGDEASQNKYWGSSIAANQGNGYGSPS